MKKRLKVLIIDDDQIDAMSIKRSLLKKESDIEIAWAQNANEGLNQIQDNSFDCVFSDFNLPDIDGITFIKKVRSLGILTPIVIVTSYGDEQVAVEAIRSGASDYIPKSLISPDGLSMSLRNALKFSDSEKRKIEMENALYLSETRLREAQKLANLGHFEVSFDTRKVEISEEASRIMSVKPEKASFNYLMQSIHPDDFKAVTSVIRDVVESKQAKNIDFRIKSTKGFKFINAHFYVGKTHNGKASRLLATIQDITQRKNVEYELRKAKDLAEESLKMRERFLANISHDIRTPMNGIIGLTNLLLEKVDDEEQRDYLKAIKSSGDNLLVIINDLLDLSKIQSGQLKFEEISFEIEEHLDTMLKLLRIKAQEKNIDLLFEFNEQIPKILKGDKYRLNQILVNLIGNALKFTEKGYVKLSVDLLQETKEEAVLIFNISDTGIGIPPVKHDFIFESFTQANIDTERKYGGTGLGLSICKQLVELQGGKIWLKSEVNKGSTFSLTLTYKKDMEAVKEQSNLQVNDMSAIDWSNKRVLLVEDNKVNILLAKKVLSNWGLQIEIAENGQEAVDKAMLSHFDVILMDLQMPVMDGYEATRIIREEYKSKIPIIVMTASAMREELEKCMFQGMNDYITKPFQSEELFRMLNHWFNKSAVC